MYNCLKCHNEVIKYKYKGVIFDLCKTCGCVVISKDNFEKLARNIDTDCKIIDLFNINPVVVKNEIRSCPYCAESMEQVYCDGVLIDRCKKCNILTFDNEELSKYFAVFSSKNTDILNNIDFLKKYCSDVNEKILKEKNIPMKIQGREVEKIVPFMSGWGILSIVVLLAIFSILLCITLIGLVLGIPLGILCFILLSGFTVLKPQEAVIYTMFGKYYGTLRF